MPGLFVFFFFLSHSGEFSHFVLICERSIGPSAGTEERWGLLARPPEQRVHSCFCQGQTSTSPAPIS